VLHVYDADHWRRLAQEARARAEKITDADARREMRAIMAQRVGYLWIIGSDVAQHTRCASAIDSSLGLLRAPAPPNGSRPAREIACDPLGRPALRPR
jgi:hypothetical protein